MYPIAGLLLLASIPPHNMRVGQYDGSTEYSCHRVNSAGLIRRLAVDVENV
jgi:hypothetical protein